VWLSPEAQQKNCNQCAANKLGCSIGSIHIAKQKRAEGSGAKAGKELKQAQVKGSDGEVESGSDDTKFVGFDMGAWVTQDLSVVLLGIRQEMSVQLEIMRQMLQVSMAQLDILWVRGNDLLSQAEVLCQIRSGLSVVRTQEAQSRSTRLQELESWGRALVAKEKSQGPSGSGEKPELGPIEGPSEMPEETSI